MSIETPELRPADSAPARKGIVFPLTQVSGWMIVSGVFYLIAVALSTLALFPTMSLFLMHPRSGLMGPIMALMMLLVLGFYLALGVWFCQAGTRLKPENLGNTHDLTVGVEKIAKIIKLQGIAFFVMIGWFALNLFIF